MLANVLVIENSKFVFPASTGIGGFQGVERVWQRVRERAGLPGLRLHDLRHSFASIGLARGDDALPVIGAILGHADVKTTSRYALLANDPVKRAADEIAKSIQAAFNGTGDAEIVPISREAHACSERQNQHHVPARKRK